MIRLEISEHEANAASAFAVARFQWFALIDGREVLLSSEFHHYNKRKSSGCGVELAIGSLRGDVMVQKVEPLFDIPKTRDAIEAVFAAGGSTQTIERDLPKDLFAGNTVTPSIALRAYC